MLLAKGGLLWPRPTYFESNVDLPLSDDYLLAVHSLEESARNV